jgi:hypothetical protein
MFTLTNDDEAHIRDAAANALRQSFAILIREKVLPCSPYRPWVWIGRDYFGDMVRGNNGPLVEALRASLPQRFDDERLPSMDYPWTYGSALLEAAVAAATLADEPYEVASPSVQATIDELIAKLRSVPRSTVLRLVADIDVDHAAVEKGYQDPLGETIEIAGVRVIRVGNRPEQFIERELPSAGYEVERSQVFVHPGPASLLVARVELMADEGARIIEARQRVVALIAAIRLATRSTAHAVIDIQGEPDRVRASHPAITPLPSWGFRFVHRPLTLSGKDVAGLTDLVALIGSFGEDDRWMTVRMALGRLGRSLDGLTPQLVDQAVDLAIGLEAALAGTDRTEIGLRLRTRAADLLATESDPPEAIYRDVKALYALRSTVVHGGRMSEKQVAKAITSLTATATGSSPAERYLLALDRWRDLLRRAILARIALTTAAKPWPAQAESERNFDIDELLLRENDRNAWRTHIRDFWEQRGLPNALEPPGAARFTIGRASTE